MKYTHNQPLHPQRQSGLTLLELMISLSLGLLVLTGIGTIFVGSNQTYRVQEQNARVQEAGRFALEIIGRSVRQAGYWEIPTDTLATMTGFSGTTINGADGGTGVPDSLTLQFDGVVNDPDCTGTGADAAGVIQDAFQLDTANNELECDGNQDDAGVVFQSLVANVEDLQFLYGVDNDNNQSADQYTEADATWSVANWNRVVSVRVCILVRSEEEGITPTAQSYLNCQGALGAVTDADAFTTATDSRLRRAFVATFNLRNRVSDTP